MEGDICMKHQKFATILCIVGSLVFGSVNAMEVSKMAPQVKALMTASKEGNLDEITRLVTIELVDVNSLTGGDKETALIKASKANNPEAVKLLLDFGADRTIIYKGYKTALYNAQKGQEENKGNYSQVIDLLTNYYPEQK